MSFDDDVAECDGIDFKWMTEHYDTLTEEEERNDRDGGPLPDFFANEKSFRARLRRIILRNPTTREYKHWCPSADFFYCLYVLSSG
ncbi:hypothetical protein BsWGS_24623 [Bradybaena similaris]